MSGGGSTQTSKSEPWEGLKPFLERLYGRGEDIYNQGSPYTNTVLPFNQGQQNALSNIYSAGMTTNPLIGSAGTFLQQQMDTGGNQGASPAFAGLMNMGYGGMVPTGYGQYGGGKQASFMELAKGYGSAPQTGYDFAGGQQAIADALSTWGKINVTDTPDVNRARPEIIGTQFGAAGNKFGIGQFNEQSYLDANPDLTPEALAGMTGAQHYGQYGAGEKRDLGLRSNDSTTLDTMKSPEDQLAFATNLIRLNKNDSGYVSAYMKEVADKGGYNPFAGLTEEQLTEAMQGQFANGADIAEYQPGNVPAEAQGGMMGGGNPFLDSMFANAAFPVANQYMTSTAPTIDAAFSRAGRYGSGAQATAQNNAADTLGRNLGGIASTMYGGAYESERNRQVNALNTLQGGFDTAQSRGLQAANMSPTIANAPMQGYLNALNAAGQWQQQGERELGETQRLNQGDMQWIMQLNSLLNGGGGWGTTTSSSGGGNAWGMGMQGIGTAIQLASLFAGSSRTLKDIVAPVDPDAILAKVAALDVGRWSYKSATPHAVTMPGEHIGPYAEDFKEAFEVGDGHHINLLDAMGVLFASVKALAARVKELEAGNV